MKLDEDKFGDSGCEGGDEGIYFKCIQNVDTRELGGIGLLRVEKKGDLRMTPKSLVFVSG